MENFHLLNNFKCLIDEMRIGVRVQHRNERFERSMILHHFLANVRKSFAEYCSWHSMFANTNHIYHEKAGSALGLVLGFPSVLFKRYDTNSFCKN